MREGILKHNGQGRYAIAKNIYFTSGDPIELFIDGIWVKGRIEYCHSNEDYYFCEDEKT